MNHDDETQVYVKPSVSVLVCVVVVVVHIMASCPMYIVKAVSGDEGRTVIMKG